MGLWLSYILKHKSGRISYRRPYNKALRPFIPGGRAELKVSLGSEGDPEVPARYAAAAAEYDRLVHAACRRKSGAFDPLDAPRIAYLAEVYRADALQDNEEARWDLAERDLFDDIAADLRARGVPAEAWPGDPAERWAVKFAATTSEMLAVYKRLRAIGDLKGVVKLWSEEAELLIEAEGLIVAPGPTADFEKLCRALNDVGIAVAEEKLRRLAGEDVPTPERPAQIANEPPTPTLVTCVPLLETFDAYAAAQGLSAGVRDEWRRYVRRLVDYLGHDDAARLTANKLREWRDHLLAEPTRRGAARDPVTVRDKYIVSLRATLAWAVEERRLPTNVAAEVKVRVPKKVKLRDRDFTPAEARGILAATMVPPTTNLSPEHARARRWIPWLCAYTGARVNEFSQLRGQDVQEIDGIWAVRITPEAGTVKAKEARTVPLHPHLIEQGFVAMAKANGPGPLFFDPDRQRVQSEGNRHFKKVGERLAAWVRNDVGITDPALQPNHAWRHTFKSLSYEAEIEERIVDAIQGHAPKTTGRGYGKPSLKALSQAVSKIPRFDIDDH